MAIKNNLISLVRIEYSEADPRSCDPLAVIQNNKLFSILHWIDRPGHSTLKPTQDYLKTGQPQKAFKNILLIESRLPDGLALSFPFDLFSSLATRDATDSGIPRRRRQAENQVVATKILLFICCSWQMPPWC